MDFGKTAQMATALERGYVFEGQPSKFRGGPFGDATADLPPERFVVCAQNHDQIGNRARGERLGALVSPERVRLAAAATVLSPHVPLLFMGEPCGETAAFQYFTSHGDAALARAVQEGRRREFPELAGSALPDPQDPATFLRSKLTPGLEFAPDHAPLFALHRELLALRNTHASLRCVPAKVSVAGEVIRVVRCIGGEKSVVLLAFDAAPGGEPVSGLHCVLDTEAPRFGGRGGDGGLRPWSARVYVGRG